MQIISVFWRRLIIFLLSLVPMLWLCVNAITQQLGADPAKTIVLFTGEWAIYFLFASLAITPLRKFFHWQWLQPHRRMLGLFALFYAFSHLLAYLVFILGFDFSRLIAELIKRPYIAVGFPAFLILIALGVTSTRSMMRRMGKNWIKLHRLIYLAVLLVWIHVLLQVRASYQDALIYGVIVLLLLGVRVYWLLRKRFT